jgi:hypothetical protein
VNNANLALAVKIARDATFVKVAAVATAADPSAMIAVAAVTTIATSAAKVVRAVIIAAAVVTTVAASVARAVITAARTRKAIRVIATIAVANNLWMMLPTFRRYQTKIWRQLS